MELYLYYYVYLFFYIPLVCAFSQGIFRRKQRPPIDGSWSSWNNWSPCYKNLKNITNNVFYPQWDNFDIQSRNRTCTAPKPLFGGKDCEPPSHRFRQCSCMNPLLGNSRIKDSFLSASSHLNGYPPKDVKFMNNTAKGWCAKSKIDFWDETYLQVNFENFTNVAAISTLDNIKGRVTRYKLQYSLNGKSWSYITRDGNNHIFTGNYFHGRRKKNNFSTHLVMKYLKVIPVQHYGLPCLKLEVYGCVFTCGSKLTAPYGELLAQSSESYDQNCLWRVEVLNTTSLTFVFSIFYVLCEDGYVDILSGDFPYSNAPLIRRICLREGDVAIPNLTLNKNSLWVKFVSNSSSNEVSFNIKYLAKCSQTIHLNKGEPVHLKSPNYPKNYFDNLNCSWTIYPPSPLKKVEINVNDFNVESSGSSTKCSDDVVIIDIEHYGGIKKKFESYCNNKMPPKKIIVSADKIIISFKSDPYINNKGFSFTVISGRKDIVPTHPNIDTAHPTGKDKPAKQDKDLKHSEHNNLNYTYTRKVKPVKDDTWTVIIICTFSSLVVVLIGTVLYMNCRRFINSRNELSAHCKKVAEENRKKKGKGQPKSTFRERNALLIQPSSPPPIKTVDDSESENYALLDAPAENAGIISSTNVNNENVKRVHSELDIHNELPVDQVDGSIDIDSACSGTSSQLSSPVKSIVVNCGSLSNEEVEESVI